MKEVGKIYVTTDYDMFKLDESNRDVDINNVSNIMQSMRKKFLITIALVLKKGDDYIIFDGQNRLESCRRLKKPYYFTILNEFKNFDKMEITFEDLPALQKTKKWSPEDKIKHYSVKGSKDYKIMQEFMEATGFPAISAHVALTGKPSVGMPKKFNDGRFKVIDIERAYDLAEIINEFKDKGMKGSTNPRFVSAIYIGLMNHTIALKPLYKAVVAGGGTDQFWVGKSIETTLYNLIKFCQNGRDLMKRHIAFTNKEWIHTLEDEK